MEVIHYCLYFQMLVFLLWVAMILFSLILTIARWIQRLMISCQTKLTMDVSRSHPKKIDFVFFSAERTGPLVKLLQSENYPIWLVFIHLKTTFLNAVQFLQISNFVFFSDMITVFLRLEAALSLKILS